MLFIPAEGGTNIDAVVQAGLEMIRMESPELRRADIVLITDGQSDPTRAAELREQAKMLGVSILGIAIGMPADTLVPWADEVEAMADLSRLPESVGR